MIDWHRLIYVSRRTDRCGDDEVHRIVTQSKTNNRGNGLCGALLVSPTTFVQILEGDRDAIEETFERIGLDSRHHSTLVLGFERIAKPVFDDWSMTLESVTDDALAGLAIGQEAATDAERVVALARDLIARRQLLSAHDPSGRQPRDTVRAA